MAAILALALLGGACADGSSDDVVAPAATSTTTTTTSAAPHLSVDWTKRVAPTPLGDWTVQSCEGDAPILCLARSDGGSGILERNEFPLSSMKLTGFAEAIAGGDEIKALNLVAQDFYQSFVRDRTKGCGREYELRAVAPTEVDVAGERGLRYGFSGNRAGEPPSERHLNHAVIKGDRLITLTLPAYDENACVAREQEMTVAEQSQLEPLLPELIAGMRLP